MCIRDSVPTKPYNTQYDLALAYTPGVAEPCLEIQKNPEDAYIYTAKCNLVAVISNGTAVLGLGDIGALAGKPVMEGKGLLFKIFADIDVFDIEVDEKDPAKFIEVVKAIAPTFGGINLEDIKAPECFEIEEKLKEALDIPLMHDDQHGTAIISSAALINALELVGKKIEDIKIVVNGAGAAASSCTTLYMALGAKLENIVMVDSKGVISTRRTDLNSRKLPFATSLPCNTLAEAVEGSDVFLGLSVEGCLTQDMVRSMAANPLVFACANPNPEISYADAMASRPDIIFATGRSDYPNQVNNVLGFPYIFRGALDVRSTGINEAMKVAAVLAIAELAKKPVPKVVTAKRQREGMTFDEAYEKMFDRNYFGMMMVEAGDADAFITGVYTKYEDAIIPAIEIVGMREGLNHIAGMNIVNTKLGTFFFADTLVNNHPSKETLIDVAKLTYEAALLFNTNPVMAMLSYSNFGERTVGSPAMVHDAIKFLHTNHPDMLIDGEMQVNFALDKDLRHEKYPFSKIDGMNVNTLIFPNLSSANISYKLMLEIGMSETIGPIQMGLNKPIHILNVESSVRDILNMVTVAVIDAQVEEQKLRQKLV